MRNRDYIMLLVLAAIVVAIGILAIGTQGHSAEKCQKVLAPNENLSASARTRGEVGR